MKKINKILLLAAKICWTLLTIVVLYMTVSDIVEGEAGVNIYIVFFHICMLIKFWFKHVNIEDAILITLLEVALCGRYIFVNTLEAVDIVVLSTQLSNVALAWSCYSERKKVINNG